MIFGVTASCKQKFARIEFDLDLSKCTENKLVELS